MSTREIFRAENIPVFQNKMFGSELAALHCPTGDVVLAQDMGTGLVSNVAFDSSLLDYDHQYQNEQSCSLVFQEHLQEVIGIIDRHCSGKTILEIGCGKGHFLERLRRRGYHATGIDPAYEGDSTDIVKAHFRSDLKVKSDCVVLRHVLEHISDPMGFLDEIAQGTHETGLIYIEVPCFDWICRNRACFDVFYEHVNYFRLEDLHSIFNKVHEAGHLFGGQYIYVVADIASLKTPRFSASVMFPSDFLAPLESLVASAATGERRIIWGAGAKGMMFALYMKRAGLDIEFAIDINPAKQERYLAGSGLTVLSPSVGLYLLGGDGEIYIMNSNYMKEIIAMSQNKFRYQQVDHHDI
ncbi:MAG: class I SAM-dependent methyltransferase [Desulfomonilaceae bacterium]